MKKYDPSTVRVVFEENKWIVEARGLDGIWMDLSGLQFPGSPLTKADAAELAAVIRLRNQIDENGSIFPPITAEEAAVLENEI